MLSIVMLLGFTLAYGYANIFEGIKDCGCFGSMKTGLSSPVMVLFRNSLLLILSIWVYKNSPKGYEYSGKTLIAILILMCMASYQTGKTSKPGEESPNASTRIKVNDLTNNTPIKNILKLNEDKKYILFFFSYNCPHCWNSIENLKKYKELNVADSILSFAVGSDEERFSFTKKFQLSSPIIPITQDKMDEVTLAYPTAFLISKNKIKYIFPAEIPSPHTFLKSYTP